MDQLTIDVAPHAHHARITVIRLQGSLDIYSGKRLQSTIGGLIGSHEPKILLDMGDLTFITTSGLSNIIVAMEDVLAAGGRLAVLNASPSIKQVFDITGLNALIRQFADEEDLSRYFEVE